MKKTYCEACGFIAEWHGQLDVDHVDGNHHNSDVSNLQTLCANCHRLKTHRASDNMNPGRVGTSNSDVASSGNMVDYSSVDVDEGKLHCACGNKRMRNRRICYSCSYYKHRKHPKGNSCLLCGFKPEWAGQLDMDHIDGNRLNNEASNLQTLCANCHRLKTHEKRDYVKQNKHEPLRAKDAPAAI